MRPPSRCLVGLVLSAVGCASPSPTTELPSDVGGSLSDAARVSDARLATGDSNTATDGDAAASPVAADAFAIVANSDSSDTARPGDAAVAPSESGLSDSDDGGDAYVYVGPARPPATCNLTGMWGVGALLAISTGSDDMLDSVTPDELSIAWTMGHGATATLAYADRTALDGAFGAPQVLTGGPFAIDRAALSPDGLRLVVVNADGRGFSELTRTSRTGPGNTFGAGVVGRYSNLNAPGALVAGQAYGDPVVSSDDVAFFYSVSQGAMPTILRTTRLLPADDWPVGAVVQASANAPLGGRPTGVSIDRQTLFLSTTSGAEVAVWLDASTGTFGNLVDLSPRTSAVPSGDCHRLYYSAPGASSVDLFVASQ